MKCQTPGCTGEHEPRAISHSVIHRTRTFVIHEETILHIDRLLTRKGRSKSAEHVFEI